MNKAIITGRLTKDPEVKKTQSGLSVCSFVLAVDRRFKDSNGNKQTDFIACTAWRQAADIVGQYCSKGSKIGVIGSLQTRRYEDNTGHTVNVTEVVAEEIEFIDTKKQEKKEEPEEVRPVPPIASDVDPDIVDFLSDSALPFDI